LMQRAASFVNIPLQFALVLFKIGSYPAICK